MKQSLLSLDLFASLISHPYLCFLDTSGFIFSQISSNNALGRTAAKASVSRLFFNLHKTLARKEEREKCDMAL